MEPYRALLSRAHLSVVSAEDDAELDAVARTIAGSVRVSGAVELAQLFDQLLAARDEGTDAVPKTLDLYGHSIAGTAQLRLGDWVVDAASSAVVAFFRELADRGVLPRLGITSMRLLACRTADTEAGRATLCRLAELLGVEVWGTRHLLYDAHHDVHGFLDAWQFLLIGSTELRRARDAAAVPRAGPYMLELDTLPTRTLDTLPTRTLDTLPTRTLDTLPTRTLDTLPTRTLDTLPTRTLDTLPTRAIDPGDGQARGQRRWPRRLATPDAVRSILTLIRRDAGAPMPGLQASPSCELVLPSRTPGQFHVMHVLFDGAFVRVYPHGDDASDDDASDGVGTGDPPGIIYPVDDPAALLRLMATLAPPPAG
jgi:hypothetical protein